MGRAIIASVLAAVVLFVWGFVSWMVLPWHAQTFSQFKDEVAVQQVLVEHAPQDGVYVLPFVQTSVSKVDNNGPFVFASVYRTDLTNMTPSLIKFYVMALIASLLVCLLLSHTYHLNYFKRIIFVMIFAVAASILADIPLWNWWHFTDEFTYINFLDRLIAWFLASLIIAGFVKGKQT